MKPRAEKVSALLKLLAHPERLMVLCHLHQGEQSAGALLEQSNLGQSAFSQHLAVLRKHEVVATRREAQTIYYRIANPEAARLIETLCSLYKGKRSS